MSRPKLGCPTGTSIRTQPASLQTGQRHVGVAAAEPLLPAGPTGMEREVRTSPMRFIGFSTAPLPVPLARFSSPGLPAFQDALDVAPGPLVIGDRLRNRIFDPL